MFSDFSLGGKRVTNPIESDKLKINMSFKQGVISEVQPILSFDRLIFVRDGVSQIKKMRAALGPYQQIPIKFNLSETEIFDGYLSEFNFLLERDEIEAKPVSFDSSDGLTELLSALDMSLLKDKFNYSELLYIIEKTDVSAELIELSSTALFYSYMLYTQIKEIYQLAVVRPTEAAGNAAGLSFGTTVALILQIAAQILFAAATLAQLINQINQMLALFFPLKKRTKVITLHELLRASLEHVGYKLETDIEDLSKVAHWASGEVDNGEYFPRSVDRCGNALGVLSLILEKYAAKIAVRNKTVFLYGSYSDKFLQNTGFKIQSFPDQNYKENLDDMIGTREIIYSVDNEDYWTYLNFKGTEYKIRANIDDPTKSTIKGLEQSNYGVALCNVKDNTNILEDAWADFIQGVNFVIQLFGGQNQALSVSNRIGAAKISSNRLGVAKLVYLNGNKVALNHRDLLSAKADENNYHWVKSHVRNPEAKTKIYENIQQKYNESSLNCNLQSNYCFSPEGIPGELKVIDWAYNYDYALLSFEIQDVERETRLIETFYEPIK